ncbi:biotin--[acetyl-CoA-carboxylase] ligase [Trinickia fusca]|uniref:biotin--[biotin carboxyl-carrier protein] ligase n=1 Tax=Trinickia fusca TaxID=2419777 RepID=A0A494XHK9_9BURK|nr:biotin--[acetyl-CoA-carboxylase] ligase [Trinickia fusca]RKP49272.1 biotin--[acetyl-CoA-carboxylase] ligase [Trinickia fusca]
MTDLTSSSQPAIPSAPDWGIDRARVLARAPHAVTACTLEIVEQTASTNSDLMARVKAMPRESVPPGIQAVRVAYLQTAGRGRQGRVWHAAPGHTLMFSLACVLPRTLSGLAGLSLAVGAALVEGLRTLPLDDRSRIALKWPNDVLLDGGKLAGILIETAWSTPAACAVVIGAGINVRHDEALLAHLAASAANVPAQARATPPAALSQALPDANLTDTLGAVLEALAAMLARFGETGFAPFRGDWHACHAYADRDVVLLEHGKEVLRGRALGVDEIGQLLVATADGVQAVATGDVSLRLAPSTP